MHNPLVSVLIPLYNAEKYLSDTLDSILSQTYKSIEIIIVDDGSTDNSFKIVKSYEKKYDSIKVYSQINSGAASARNKAFSLSNGEYIQYFDADDIMHPEKISSQIEALKKYNFRPDIAAIGQWFRFYDQIHNLTKQSLKTYRNYDDTLGFIVDAWSNAHYIIGQAWLISRPLHEKVGDWDKKISVLDDSVFFGKIAYQAKKIIYVPNSIVYWRQDNLNSLSKNTTKEGMQSHLLACDNYVEIVKDDLDYPGMKKALALEYSKFIYVAYPRYMDLIKKAEETIVELGFDTPLPLPTTKFRLAEKIMGFYPAATLFAAKDRLTKKIRLKIW